ncbi:hypothetical protein ASF56_23610 [Methylobacterium sp. Leaf122]|nr:hypothetical protein ASF56_23610 [Methylobacterium sp. Leaf122]
MGVARLYVMRRGLIEDPPVSTPRLTTTSCSPWLSISSEALQTPPGSAAAGFFVSGTTRRSQHALPHLGHAVVITDAGRRSLPPDGIGSAACDGSPSPVATFTMNLAS